MKIFILRRIELETTHDNESKSVVYATFKFVESFYFIYCDFFCYRYLFVYHFFLMGLYPITYFG